MITSCNSGVGPYYMMFNPPYREEKRVEVHKDAAHRLGIVHSGREQ
jgi:hypothetical protein